MTLLVKENPAHEGSACPPRYRWRPPRKSGYTIVKGQKHKLLRVVTDERDGNAWTADSPFFASFTLQALLQTVSNVSHKAKRDNKSRAGEYSAVNTELRH